MSIPIWFPKTYKKLFSFSYLQACATQLANKPSTSKCLSDIFKDLCCQVKTDCYAANIIIS